jgi:hypothetical protein
VVVASVDVVVAGGLVVVVVAGASIVVVVPGGSIVVVVAGALVVGVVGGKLVDVEVESSVVVVLRAQVGSPEGPLEDKLRCRAAPTGLRLSPAGCSRATCPRAVPAEARKASCVEPRGLPLVQSLP